MDETDAMPSDGTIPEHGIGVVERRTGISQHLLRAWERRYGIVTPVRTGTNQRLYSDQDIERLRLVRIVAAGGRRIGQVITMPVEKLRELAGSDARESVAPARSDREATSRADVDEYYRGCLDAVNRLDDRAVHDLLMRAATALGSRTFIDGVAAPLLRAIGDGWEKDVLRPANEHALSVGLRRVLSRLLASLPAPAGAPFIVIGTPPDQRHEFGAMFAAIVAASRKWRVSYIGADLPIDDIAYAARLARADAVALSIVRSSDPSALQAELRQLRGALPDSVPLVAGGHAATLYGAELATSGAIVIPDFDAWDSWLDATAASGFPAVAG